MRFWLDIPNAPDATFLYPIDRELRNRGHEVLVTAWDRGQTRPLVEERWSDAEFVNAGEGFRRSITKKAFAVAKRTALLIRFARAREVDSAFGLNSYSQLIAARAMGLPSATYMDYEYQPANHVGFRFADWVILPEAIPLRSVRWYGAGPRKTLRGPLKEEITFSQYRPDPHFRKTLGIDEDRPLVTVRPSAEGALYHRQPNHLVLELLPQLVKAGATVLVSPRTQSQGAQLSSVPGVRVVEGLVSGADLIYHSDLVIGGGGTMTREAAVLGTPSFTIFLGRLGGVDKELIRTGRLKQIRQASDLTSEEIRQRPAKAWEPDPAVVTRFVDMLTALSGGGSRSGSAAA